MFYFYALLLRRRVFLGFVVALLSPLLCSGNAQANSLNSVFQLHNHDDGNARPPLYGLRLDDLLGTGTGVFTFDFDHAASNVQMTIFADDTVVIEGPVFGGRDVGSAYDSSSGLWDLSFTYHKDDVEVLLDTGTKYSLKAGDSKLHTGVITARFTGGDVLSGDSYSLSSFMNPSFLFDNTSNHRGASGFAGRGWLNVGNQPHKASQDWLFTAEPISSPEPTSMALFALGTGIFVPISRRRRRQQRVVAGA